ncbi:MAG: helix-turn-helix domain-containing protein [Thermoplasmata archaeon]
MPSAHISAVRPCVPAPTSLVRLVQALAAREGVEQLGLSSRRVAELLGIAPSAVSQYLSGKRREEGFLRFSTDDAARAIARKTLERLIRAHEEGRSPVHVVLEEAVALAELTDHPRRTSPGHAPPSSAPVDPRLRQLSRWIRQRVRAEQVAVTECMRLAQRARDELTRAILRQIASDSLRHAEIVTSLLPYIDRGVTGAFAAGITRKEIEALIEGERRAESQADAGLAHHLQGTMAILVASMEADERKHTELLRGLLSQGFRT